MNVLEKISRLCLDNAFLFQTYWNWQDNKIMTTVNTTGLPIRHIPFPAITICGLGSVDSVMKDMLWTQVGENYS